jgi:hypothetical protein
MHRHDQIAALVVDIAGDGTAAGTVGRCTVTLVVGTRATGLAALKVAAGVVAFLLPREAGALSVHRPEVGVGQQH